jgi:aspartate racemase
MRGIHGLRQAGCGAIVTPCNTVHGRYVSMAETAALPILHIDDAAAAELRRIGVFDDPVGVTGTEVTLAMRLYQNRLAGQDWDFIEPEAAQMRHLVTPAIQAVKANCVAEACAPLVEVVNSVAARGATAVVLGCTEIPLAIQAGSADASRVPWSIPSMRLPRPRSAGPGARDGER